MFVAKRHTCTQICIFLNLNKHHNCKHTRVDNLKKKLDTHFTLDVVRSLRFVLKIPFLNHEGNCTESLPAVTERCHRPWKVLTHTHTRALHKLSLASLFSHTLRLLGVTSLRLHKHFRR